jgi:DnaJ like chaperone protein
MRTLYIILGILYLLFPRDLVPDYLVGWGWLDDLVVLGLLFRYLYKQKKKLQAGRTQSENFFRGGDRGRPDGDPRTENTQGRPDPYTVLGVDASASPQEIKKAYRSLVSKYHPDKVAHLGDEFRQMAEKRFKEIQQAYQEIRDSRK